MSRRSKRQPPRQPRWRLLVVAVAAVALVAVGFYWFRVGPGAAVLAQSPSTQTPAGMSPAATAGSASSSEYTQRVVAYIYENTAITREELGEYLIARGGAEKLESLVNRRIIEEECKRFNIEVTTKEVEAALGEDLKGLSVGLETFVNQVLKNYKKTLYEWKEDVLRPRLMMTALVRNSITYTEDDVRKAFEAAYGEKIDGRLIVWPKNEKARADEAYPKISISNAEFEEVSKRQAATNVGGKLKAPIGRYTIGNEDLDRAMFSLQVDEVSQPVLTEDGWAVFKCDRRLPADATVNYDTVKPQMIKDVIEKKLQLQIKTTCEELKKKARARLWPDGRNGSIVAYLYENMPISREELGEYLIARYGAEKLELLVNKRIIEQECKASKIEVAGGEVDATLAADLKGLNMDEKTFVTQLLKTYKKTLYEWKEDVLRPKLLMTRLIRNKITATEEDVRMAFEAYYGEKINCRLILYPPGEENHKRAMADYPSIRDSDAVFVQKAKEQFSPQLASRAGHLEKPVGHHTTGNENLEHEMFSLQPGEVSPVIETPEGFVVVKCDGREPPDTTASLEAVRSRLVQEVLDKKLQAEIPRTFEAMKEKANPRLLLEGANRKINLASEIKRDLANPLPAPRHTREPHGGN